MHYDPKTLKNLYKPQAEIRPMPGKPAPNLSPLVRRFANKRTR